MKIFNLIQNHWVNVNQTWYKASLDERDSSLFKRPHPPPRRDNSEVLKLYKQHFKILFMWAMWPMGQLLRLNEGGQKFLFFFRRDHWYPKWRKHWFWCKWMHILSKHRYEICFLYAHLSFLGHLSDRWPITMGLHPLSSVVR